jgi:hypothetical protein
MVTFAIIKVIFTQTAIVDTMVGAGLWRFYNKVIFDAFYTKPKPVEPLTVCYEPRDFHMQPEWDKWH